MLKKFNQKISEGFLFTDQYQLVMAQLYYMQGMHENEVQFDHFFRSYPDYGTHKAGYCINAGLEWIVDWMKNSAVTDKDIELLKNQRGNNGARLFDDNFLKWLRDNGNFETITLNAIPEGRVVHPNEPLTVIQGPLALAQILETALLNQLNFQTLIATKASRIKLMAKDQPLLEFGARRAHDRGANAGVRAALIGGADFTSNVGISSVLGFPPKGTHAHSMVQFYIASGMTEYDAFKDFADLYPDDCILLVDTVNSIESGIPNAIKVFKELKKKGHKPVGIRLDSGDLAYLTVAASKMLNDAGLDEVKIVLSNELDELNIWQILTQIKEEATKKGLDTDSIVKRLIYGVGTRLITSSGDSSLGGVYKLVAINNTNGWQPAIKISETREKIPNPGNKQVWRLINKNGKSTADLITLDDEKPGKKDKLLLQHPFDSTKSREIITKELNKIQPLLETVIKNGKIVYDFPDLEEIRKLRKNDIETLDSGVKRLINPHRYHVSLSQKLWKLKNELISDMIK